jgi:hypothetical protein
MISNILYKIFFYNFFSFFDSKMREIMYIRYTHLDNKITKKIARNFVCLFHAVVSVLLSFNYMIRNNNFNYSFMENYSCGYFIFDFIYILLYDKKSIVSCAYLYHHLASIYILIIGRDYYVYKILFWAEISNIPSYFVYHYIKTKSEDNVKLWKNIQKIVYIIVRMPILGYLSFDIFNKVENKYPIYICFPVYIMGIIWSFMLLNDKN